MNKVLSRTPLGKIGHLGISANEIEMLLMRLPRMFKQEFTGVGATLEKRWKFCAFEGIKTT
ncbi:Ecto-NOX disulfide-thiol exchanger 1 [Chelonia mydas]|uniref:Ecto-NOX disulfide-thiol exchanger 1 n=1 Tax=Chelonia mydas TaxID=8469 RepID=M7BB34_CHEMY|nr:Ecto-NOX disulfide-thiol exchanger 1 [Chelonia mydas]